MFSKLALFAVASMAVFVAAAPTEGGIENSCNTGPVQCCNQYHQASSSQADFLKGIFNIAAGPISGDVGATCTPITGIGASGTSCSSQPVCCNNNKFEGVVAFGCSPINFNV
ncbi:fungal hydrophobin [Phlegmacium glaucopus]|nr:fungal hydrophobin [Phlegmacium glaucopus]